MIYPCCDQMAGPIWLDGKYCRPVCPVHGYQVEPASDPKNARIAQLEAENARLRKALTFIRDEGGLMEHRVARAALQPKDRT